MKIILLATTLLFSSFILISCKKDNPIPPGDQTQLSLTLEDVSCTEAWIKLTTANISLPADVALLKDDNPVKTISLISADTILYIDSLLPNHTYKFQSSIQSINQSSNLLTVTTMDTTSHNFTWQSWTFGGQAGSCTLYDVAIINENDIWAVGEIYLLDSIGVPDPNAYNAVHWDGNQWELEKIKTNSCGGVKYPPIKTIFAFSGNDILFAHIDGSISHYNGIEFTNDCSLITQLNGSANKIWGVSKNDFYVVSGSGFIAHCRNGQWSRIESGTDANINDIWGVMNQITNERKIFCAVPSGYDITKRRILTIDQENNIDSLRWNGKVVTSIWTNNGKFLYTSGDGIYNNKAGNWTDEISIPFYYTNRIRGNNLNDIFVCGNYGFLAHFNGMNWKVYNEFLQMNTSVFRSIALKNNIVVAVGFDGESALIIIGISN